MLIDVINRKLEYISWLERRQAETLSSKEMGHLLLQAKWCFQVPESLEEVSRDACGSVCSTHGASTCKCLLQWDIFTKANPSLTRPTWNSFDMSEFIFLCTQLEKANYKTNQPEARKPFGSISEAPNFAGGGGEPMTTEALGLHLAYLLLQLLVSLDKTGRVLNGKWKMTH